jgi:hypothetical protein
LHCWASLRARTRELALREATHSSSADAPRAVFALPERQIQPILGLERALQMKRDM